MKAMKYKSLLLALHYYVAFFILAAFVVTCCMLLFMSVMAKEMGIIFTEDNIQTAARLTFGNVVVLSALFTAVDAVRRKILVTRPIRRITAAAERMTAGDFSVRIPPARGTYGEENYGQIINCLNKMAQTLSGVETLRTDFIANVSHELKTPLTVMRNYAVLLQSPDLPEEKRMEYAKGVSDASIRLSNLISNILRLNKLENQQITPTAEAFDLSDQLIQCLLQYEHVWESKGIDIDTEIPDGIRVQADPELMALVWNNLLSNAFKFTESGGTVSLKLTADGETVTVRVSDTGCGMTPEVGEHIFEKFYQGDTSHSSQGNGLGLALVKRVVDMVQGEIQVESVSGKGSAFAVKLQRGNYE